MNKIHWNVAMGMNLWNKTATEKTSYRIYIVLFTYGLTKLFRSFSDTKFWGPKWEWHSQLPGGGPRSGTWEWRARALIPVSCSPSGWVTNGCFVLLMFAYTLCLFYKYSQLLQSINKQKLHIQSKWLDLIFNIQVVPKNYFLKCQKKHSF